MNPEEAEAKLLAHVPVAGEVDYESLYSTLMAGPDRDAVRAFHKMRRTGKLIVRLEVSENGKLIQLVSRPVPPAQG